MREEFNEALAQAKSGVAPAERADNVLRRHTVAASRKALEDLRTSGAIGDDAYHRAEEELDWLELSARGGE
jgi:CPA1 family monovalent cation:H+ antiporter